MEKYDKDAKHIVNNCKTSNCTNQANNLDICFPRLGDHLQICMDKLGTELQKGLKGTVRML